MTIYTGDLRLRRVKSVVEAQRLGTFGSCPFLSITPSNAKIVANNLYNLYTKRKANICKIQVLCKRKDSPTVAFKERDLFTRMQKRDHRKIKDCLRILRLQYHQCNRDNFGKKNRTTQFNLLKARINLNYV
jgi:hypothetical protein